MKIQDAICSRLKGLVLETFATGALRHAAGPAQSMSQSKSALRSSPHCVGMFWFVTSILSLLMPNLGAFAQSSITSARVVDVGGRQHTLQISADSNIVAMATWCPHSAELKSLLNHPDLKPFARRAHIVLVFRCDEWATVKYELNSMVKDGSITEEQAESRLAELKEKAEGSVLFDPEFLADIGFDSYVLPQNCPLQPEDFPSQYDCQSGKFSKLQFSRLFPGCDASVFNAAFDSIYKSAKD